VQRAIPDKNSFFCVRRYCCFWNISNLHNPLPHTIRQIPVRSFNCGTQIIYFNDVFCAPEQQRRRRAPGPVEFMDRKKTIAVAPDQSNATGILPAGRDDAQNARPGGKACTVPVSELASCSAEASGSATFTQPIAPTGRLAPHHTATAPGSDAAQESPRPASIIAQPSVADDTSTASAPGAPHALANICRIATQRPAGGLTKFLTA